MSTPYSSAPSVNVRYSLAAMACAAPDPGAVLLAVCIHPSHCLTTSRRLRARARETADVHDESDATVAHDGCAGDPEDPAVIAFEALDHDLLLADQLVDLHRELAALGFEDDDDAFVHRRRRLADAEQVMHRLQRHVLVAHLEQAPL